MLFKQILHLLRQNLYLATRYLSPILLIISLIFAQVSSLNVHALGCDTASGFGWNNTTSRCEKTVSLIRKNYLNITVCGIDNPSGSDYAQAFYSDGRGGGGINVSDTATNPVCSSGSYTSTSSQSWNLDLNSGNVLNIKACGIDNNNNHDYWQSLYSDGHGGGGISINNSAVDINCTTPGFAHLTSQNLWSLDLNSGRYINIKSCGFFNSNNNDYWQSLYSDGHGGGGISISSSSTSISCSSSSFASLVSQNQWNLDILKCPSVPDYTAVDQGPNCLVYGPATFNTQISDPACTVNVDCSSASIKKKYAYTSATNSDQNSVSIGLSNTVIVRLKYTNLLSQTITNSYITDTVPSGFTFVSSSLKNCYTASVCINLNDNLFDQGFLHVAPQAGYFGNNTDNSVTQSSLNSNSYGYIEYRIVAPSVGGVFGSKVYLYGSFTNSPVVDNSEYTITVGGDVPCSNIQPSSGYNINLGDAELRTDQDFRCQYSAKICVVIFNDLNGDSIFNGVDNKLAISGIKLFLKDGSTEIYNINSSDTVDQCFEPLENGKVYRVEVTNPPTAYSTTGGNSQTIGITYSSGTQTLNFGYSNGTISLSAQQNVSFTSTEVSSSAQELCATIYDIEVVETRPDKPGWTVNATIDDFEVFQEPSKKLAVAGKLRAIPQTVTVVAGNQNGINLGQTKTVASTSDQIQVFSSSSNYGLGTYKTNLNICLTIPPFSRTGLYTSKVYFTV